MSDQESRDVAQDVAETTTNDDLQPVAPERSDLPPLHEYNVFATFDDPEVARDAIVALERSGIDGTRISALALDLRDNVEPGEASTRSGTAEQDGEMLSEMGSDVGKGAAIGAIAGALGSTAVALAIPGVGIAIGAGILAVAAGGAVAGTGVGGFAGAVSSTPASHGWEQALLDIDDGRVVIGVHSDDSESHDQGLQVLAGTENISILQLGPDGERL